MVQVSNLSVYTSHSQATEAIRAFFTLHCCWLNQQEIYLEQGCLHCGSAATYLIYYTNRKIQAMMLNFIDRYNCIEHIDLLDIESFSEIYDEFLQHLEIEINRYACGVQHLERLLCFEDVESIFERSSAMIC